MNLRLTENQLKYLL